MNEFLPPPMGIKTAVQFISWHGIRSEYLASLVQDLLITDDYIEANVNPLLLENSAKISSFGQFRLIEVTPCLIQPLDNINEWLLFISNSLPKITYPSLFKPTAISILELESSSATGPQMVFSAKLDTSSAASSPPPGLPQCQKPRPGWLG